jgi:hypothetical protein
VDELLKELPLDVRQVLDTAQFARLDDEQSAALRALSELTDSHVIAHRLRMPHGLPLWEVAGPAYHLDKHELDALHQTQRVVGSDIALVAYARPLELRLPAHVLVSAAGAYPISLPVSSGKHSNDSNPHRG